MSDLEKSEKRNRIRKALPKKKALETEDAWTSKGGTPGSAASAFEAALGANITPTPIGKGNEP